VSYLFDPFTYEFMQRALAESVLMSVACGLLGTLIVLRGLTFTGESLSHTLLPGAAIAVALGFAVVAGALAAGLLAALLIAVLLRRPEIGEDAVISVVFTGAFAAGVIVLSTHGTPKDLDSLLFGSILAVEPGDLWIGLGTTLGVAAVVGLARRGFVLVAFDRAFASAGARAPGVDDALARSVDRHRQLLRRPRNLVPRGRSGGRCDLPYGPGRTGRGHRIRVASGVDNEGTESAQSRFTRVTISPLPTKTGEAGPKAPGGANCVVRARARRQGLRAGPRR
jgi:hypothetical protein